MFSVIKGICLLRRHLSLRYDRFEDYSGAEGAEGLDEWEELAVPKEALASGV